MVELMMEIDKDVLEAFKKMTLVEIVNEFEEFTGRQASLQEVVFFSQFCK